MLNIDIHKFYCIQFSQPVSSASFKDHRGSSSFITLVLECSEIYGAPNLIYCPASASGRLLSICGTPGYIWLLSIQFNARQTAALLT